MIVIAGVWSDPTVNVFFQPRNVFVRNLLPTILRVKVPPVHTTPFSTLPRVLLRATAALLWSCVGSSQSFPLLSLSCRWSFGFHARLSPKSWCSGKFCVKNRFLITFLMKNRLIEFFFDQLETPLRFSSIFSYRCQLLGVYRPPGSCQLAAPLNLPCLRYA